MKRKKSKFEKGRSLSIVRHFFPKVSAVVDADRPAIIEVTLKDERQSTVRSHRTCALAVACKRSFRADGVIIGLTTSYIIKGNVATRFQNTGAISREITSFDRKAGFDLGRYQLSPFSDSVKLGAYKGHKPHAGRRNGNTIKKFRHLTQGVRTTLGRIS